MEWLTIPGTADMRTPSGRFKLLIDEEKVLAEDTFFGIDALFFSVRDADDWCKRRQALDRDGSHDVGAMRPW
jgi:hypothetical protein